MRITALQLEIVASVTEEGLADYAEDTRNAMSDGLSRDHHGTTAHYYTSYLPPYTVISWRLYSLRALSLYIVITALYTPFTLQVGRYSVCCINVPRGVNHLITYVMQQRTSACMSVQCV